MFVANERLKSIANPDEHPPPERTKEQDLESVLWVLFYAIFRNATTEGAAAAVDTDPELIAHLTRDFHSVFSPPTPLALDQARRFYLHLEWRRPAWKPYFLSRSARGANFYAVFLHCFAVLKLAVPVFDGVHELDEFRERIDGYVRPPKLRLTHEILLDRVLGDFWGNEYGLD